MTLGWMVVCLLLLAYAWAGYPLIVRRLAAGRKEDIPDRTPSGLTFAVVLAAHNEAEVIAARVRNLLETCAGVPACTDILLGLDGCTDGTVAAAHAALENEPAGRVTLHDFPVRRGKVAVLKDLVSRVTADVLVFTDANTHFESDAVPRLLAHFACERVGGVVGRLVLGVSGGGDGTGHPEGAYWGWETALKKAESDLDSCLGANGAIYAVRRELFWTAIPDNTIVDDFVIGMKVREQGRRLVYEPGAVAREELPEVAAEWNRRVRIGAGDYQALALCAACLRPRYGWFAWSFASHKVLRWFTPHLVLILLALSVGSVQAEVGLLSTVILAGASVVLLLALAGQMDPGAARPLRLCAHFVTMQAALLAGFLRYCRGGLGGAWERTPR